jgi:hypothetical protein
MPADLVPHEAIPALAAGVTMEMLKVLRRIQHEGVILNSADLDQQTAAGLQKLAERGLVDPVYDGPTDRPPYMWVSNGNGSRVLSYKTGIRSGPYYEIPSTELAAWLEQQGIERWWNVDGDSLLTGSLTFPCPGDELAETLRAINRPLLIQAKKDDTGAVGQLIGADKLNEVVAYLADTIHVIGPAQAPPWGSDRLLYLCWKGSPDEWLLIEDSETTEQMRAEERATTTEIARVKKE